jgi:hypothetical protein
MVIWGFREWLICSTINRSIKKINVFIGTGSGRFGYKPTQETRMVLPPGNIESVPVMPSSPEPSNTNVDLSESIGKGNNIVVKKMA